MDERCAWARSSELYVAYHDEEWGVPVHDDRRLFEFLILEGAQAGLSWRQVLERREGYRRAFDGFDAAKIARYDAARIERLIGDAGIIRNRAKIQAAVTNARVFLELRERYDSFDRYLWQFVGGKPVQNAWRSTDEVPASTLESDTLSRELKRLGFKFVGSTICYAFMQAVGMVNDHVKTCFRWKQVAALGK
ncbi:MAG TPA: DNA-3-methyladenine glycosylase I [Burkholderiales bacterium]